MEMGTRVLLTMFALSVISYTFLLVVCTPSNPCTATNITDISQMISSEANGTGVWDFTNNITRNATDYVNLSSGARIEGADLFTVFTTTLDQVITLFTWIGGMAGAPIILMQAMHMPQLIWMPISVMWYIILVIALAQFVMNRRF